MFEDRPDNKYRFVARLVGKRHLLRFYSDSGQWIPIQARQLAEQTLTPHRFYKLIKRHGKTCYSHYTDWMGKGSSARQARIFNAGRLSACWSGYATDVADQFAGGKSS